MMEPLMQIECPICHKSLEAESKWSGQKAQCPYCKSVFYTPDVAVKNGGKKNNFLSLPRKGWWKKWCWFALILVGVLAILFGVHYVSWLSYIGKVRTQKAQLDRDIERYLVVRECGALWNQLASILRKGSDEIPSAESNVKQAIAQAGKIYKKLASEMYAAISQSDVPEEVRNAALEYAQAISNRGGCFKLRALLYSRQCGGGCSYGHFPRYDGRYYWWHG